MKRILSRVILELFRPVIFLFDIAYQDNLRTFKIKKGKHRSCFRFKPVIIESAMSFIVKFNTSAAYTTKDPVNQWDINKLWGFSEYLFSPHIDSARMGWNWREGQLYLRPYSYCNGKTQIDPPEIPVEIGKEISCLIILLEDRYVFYINEKRVADMPRTKRNQCIIGLQLYPYFGGNSTAPHTISIQIKT